MIFLWCVNYKIFGTFCFFFNLAGNLPAGGVKKLPFKLGYQHTMKVLAAVLAAHSLGSLRSKSC
jgi:hypothetical protein